MIWVYPLSTLIPLLFPCCGEKELVIHNGIKERNAAVFGFNAAGGLGDLGPLTMRL